MNFNDFVELLNKQSFHETIYEDTEGREILVIRTLDLFAFVNKFFDVSKTPEAK